MTSHSSTSRFNTCPFAYKLHADGYRKVFEGAEANYKVLGKAAHAALQAHYSGQDFDAMVTAFDKLYPTDLDPTDKVWNREGGIRMLEAYVNYYKDIDKMWQIEAVELPDNPDKPTLIIDLLVKHKQTGSIYLVDHKFKKKAPWGVDRRYAIDAQMLRYTDYVLNNYGDCAGAVVNIAVPGFRQKSYKGEPPGWHFKFERTTVGFTPQQLDFWRESQAEWEAVVDHCNSTGHYPKHFGYNCGRCEFYELCVSANDEEVREALYTTDPVEPAFEVVVEEDE